MAWIDRPWSDLAAHGPRTTLVTCDDRLLLQFWEHMFPLITCTQDVARCNTLVHSNQEYIGRASMFHDAHSSLLVVTGGDGCNILRVHCLEPVRELLAESRDLPVEVTQRVVDRVGDFLLRWHANATDISLNDVMDAFWLLALYPGFSGYLLLGQTGAVLLSMPQKIVSQHRVRSTLDPLHHTTECAHMDGVSDDTFDNVWCRLALDLYAVPEGCVDETKHRCLPLAGGAHVVPGDAAPLPGPVWPVPPAGGTRRSVLAHRSVPGEPDPVPTTANRFRDSHASLNAQCPSLLARRAACSRTIAWNAIVSE